MGDERRGVIFAASAAVLFGTAYVATGWALLSFTPLSAAAWRGLLATAGIVLVILVAPAAGAGTGSALRLDLPRLLRLAVLGLTGGLVFIAGMNVAVAGAGATIASFVASLYAVLAALFAPFVLGEPLGRRALAGFVAALAGTALLSGLSPTPGLALGIAAGLVAAVSFALYLVLARRWSQRYALRGSPVALATFATAGLGLLIVEAVIEPAALLPADPDPRALLGLAWLALLSSCAAQLLVLASVRRIDARRSSAFLLLNPLTATLGAAVVLGERVESIQFVGGALVLAGIALASGVTWRRASSRSSPA